MPGLEDPFFSERLNPLFLRLIQIYWETFLKANIKEKELLEKSQMNILRFVFRRLFQPIYLNRSLKVEGSVFFLSRILTDGIGDYFSLLKSAMALKKKQPSIDVHVVYTHQQTLPIVNLSAYLLDCKHVHSFQETTQNQVLEKVLEGCLKLPFEDKIKELETEREDYRTILIKQGDAVKYLQEIVEDFEQQIYFLKHLEHVKLKAETLYGEMKNSLAIVNIALAINTFENPFLSSKSMYFAEMGNFQGIGNYLQRNWFSMGLHPFEEGVFLQKTFLEKTAWKDPKLPLFLWNTVDPTSEMFLEYSKTHNLHVGYLHQIAQQRQVFIHLLCLMHRSDPRSMDILLPRFQEEEFDVLNPDWLAAQGITKVISIDFDRPTPEVLVVQTQAVSNKTVRLIHVLPIPSSDFEKCLEISEPIVGCTGDGSLSESLMFDKIPYYELRKHKLATREAFQQLAEDLDLKNVTAYFEEIANYKNIPPEVSAERLCRILEQVCFKKEWQDLLKFIKQYYCFEEALVSHLNRQILMNEKSSLMEKEEEFVRKYLEGNISASQAYAKMSQEFDKN